MKLSAAILAALVALSLTEILPAVEVRPEDLKVAERKLQERDTFEVKFSQQIKTGLRKRESMSRGTALFGKPNLFRWTLEHPVKQEMVFDGQNLIQFDADMKSANRIAPTADKRRELEEVISAATSIEGLLGKYNLEKGDRDAAAGTMTLNLKPKRNDTGMKAITLRVSETQNFVEMVRLEFNNGSSNVITFSHPQNVKRSTTTFVFSPPNGVKVNEIR